MLAIKRIRNLPYSLFTRASQTLAIGSPYSQDSMQCVWANNNLCTGTSDVPANKKSIFIAHKMHALITQKFCKQAIRRLSSHDGKEILTCELLHRMDLLIGTRNTFVGDGESAQKKVLPKRQPIISLRCTSNMRAQSGNDGDAISDPLNSVNKQITIPEIQDILCRYGLDLPIVDGALYKRAFVHRSYIQAPQFEGLQTQPSSHAPPPHTLCNETLEFIGDGVLNCIATSYLYQRFPYQNEGFLTDKKSLLVRNDSIGKLALEMGLQKWFILSSDAELSNTRYNVKKLGCLFEAFVGAIFLDFNKVKVCDENKLFGRVFSSGPGFQAAQVFVESVFDKHFDLEKVLENDENFKNILQMKIQKEFKVSPVYLEIVPYDQNVGLYHMGVYLCVSQKPLTRKLRPKDAVDFAELGSFADIHDVLLTKGRVFVCLGKGVHKNKRKAEQLACENALERIEDYIV